MNLRTASRPEVSSKPGLTQDLYLISLVSQEQGPRAPSFAVVALASDPNAHKKTGRVFSSWALAKEYKFSDLDGTRPDWGAYARKRYEKYKICDEKFYSYWVPGLVEMIFPEWF